MNDTQDTTPVCGRPHWWRQRENSLLSSLLPHSPRRLPENSKETRDESWATLEGRAR